MNTKSIFVRLRHCACLLMLVSGLTGCGGSGSVSKRLTGIWRSVAPASGVCLDLKQSGTALTGAGPGPISGTVQGNAVMFTIAPPGASGRADEYFSGSVNGNTLVGTFQGSAITIIRTHDAACN